MTATSRVDLTLADLPIVDLPDDPFPAARAEEAAAASRPADPRAIARHAVDRRVSWMRRYQRRLVLVDLVAAAAAVALAFLVRFGLNDVAGTGTDNLLVCALLPLAWITLVAINRAYEGRFIGVGSQEFSRMVTAFLQMTALLSFASFAGRVSLSRGFILGALPLCLVFGLAARYAARKWLHHQRAKGRALTSVLVVGDAAAIVDFTTMLRRDRHAGLQVVGACVPADLIIDAALHAELDGVGVQVLGDVDSILGVVAASRADTVAVVSSGLIGPEKLRRISWQLEGTSTDLVISPGLMEVTGPRLHIQPVAGLPLLHVDEPEFTGFRRLLKGAFDRAVAATVLLALSPVLLAVAIAVRLTSRGPALFRQTRVGQDGHTFTLFKFRSMYVDAEARRAALVGPQPASVLFKLRDDPRVTRIGRVLRKYSIDELPQLVNVVTGRMSLVGPRPPLPTEVAQYEDHVHRRLLVKPGLTGLWQVSGRSDLAWEESVRLDLRYVENWSMANDLMIIWKTLFAVLRGAGAY